MIPLLLACTGAPSAPEPATTVQANESSELDRLRALGYLDAAPTDEDAASGLTVLDEARSQPGHNLFLSRNLRRADLIDAQGRLLHTWSHGEEGAWTRVKLQPDGGLLVVGSSQAPRRNNTHVDASRFVMKLTWGGELAWRTSLNGHHDVTETPEGGLLALDFTYRQIPELTPGLTYRDDQLTWLSSEGEIQQRRSLTEFLLAEPRLQALQPVAPNAANGLEHVDLLHANAVSFIEPSEHEGRLYAAGNLLVSSRHQDLVFILDPAEGNVVWAWGPGEISGPHDPSMLPNGNILLFDNGLDRRWSRVIELDPRTDTIVWEYRGDPPQDFFTVSRGSAQRLDNGNTLIAESDEGRAFEVTPEGELVWEFLNPHELGPGRRATFNRMERLPKDGVR